MIYRPQFAFPLAQNCQDHRCSYSFDKTNTPTFSAIPIGARIDGIPLKLDDDAPFFLRGIQIFSIDTALSFNGSRVLVQLQDCYNNPLSANYRTDGTGYLDPVLWGQTDGAGIVTLDNCDDWGIYCPAGGRFKAFLSNTSSSICDLYVSLHGVKRYAGARCA